MNRLIRTALTLFASSSVLIFIVLKRLEKARDMVGDVRVSEIQMAYLGIGMAALMLAIGLGLVITAVIRARKAKIDPPNHG
jgi:hypothetical protein